MASRRTNFCGKMTPIFFSSVKVQPDSKYSISGSMIQIQKGNTREQEFYSFISCLIIRLLFFKPQSRLSAPVVKWFVSYKYSRKYFKYIKKHQNIMENC